MNDCVYRGEKTGDKIGDRPSFGCQLHERCVLSGETSEAASCEHCKQGLKLDARLR